MNKQFKVNIAYKFILQHKLCTLFRLRFYFKFKHRNNIKKIYYAQCNCNKSKQINLTYFHRSVFVVS